MCLIFGWTDGDCLCIGPESKPCDSPAPLLNTKAFLVHLSWYCTCVVVSYVYVNKLSVYLRAKEQPHSEKVWHTVLREYLDSWEGGALSVLYCNTENVRDLFCIWSLFRSCQCF